MVDEEQKGNWLKLYRSFLDWEWYTDVNTKVVFLHCLLKANWTPGRLKGVVIPAGSFATSYASLSRDTGLSVYSCRTAIKHLISTGEVTSHSHHDFTVITVVRWQELQGEAQANPQATHKQPTSNPQRYKNKRNKESKNIYTDFDQRTVDYEELQRRLVNK